MARFKAPKITTAQRLSMVLELSELVFDTDEKRFYAGDDLTNGGLLVGSGLSKNVFEVNITNQMILNKEVALPAIPTNPNSVTLEFYGGTKQRNGIDFEVQSGTNILTWSGLGIDGFIEENDKIIIEY